MSFLRHNAIVSTLFENCVVNVRSDELAGPVSTRPDVLNREPWQGQTYAELSNPVIVHASCVHVAVSAVNVSCAVRATWQACTQNVRRDGASARSF